MTDIPPSHPGLYLTKVWASAPMSPVPPGKVSGVCSSRPSRPEALGSPESYVVSPDYRLLWPHPKLSVSPTGLFASSRGVFVLRSSSNGYREAPQFTPRVFLTVPSYVPRQTRWPLSTVSSPPTLAFAFSAHSRHLQFPPLRFPGGRCNEAATFALCYGPVSCLPYTGKGFYFRAFTTRGHPQAASSITTRSNSQLPEPDLHRLDTRPYGLRTENTETSHSFEEKINFGKHFWFLPKPCVKIFRGITPALPSPFRRLCRNHNSVIASDRRERGNLIIFNALSDCFGRFTPSQ